MIPLTPISDAQPAVSATVLSRELAVMHVVHVQGQVDQRCGRSNELAICVDY